MKLKALPLALAALALAAPAAFAGNGNGNGHGHGHGAGKPACHAGQFVFAGTLAADPTGTSFAVAVTAGNARGAKLAGKQLTVDASKARIVEQGRKTVADLRKGDRVLVKGKSCAAVDGSAAFVASQVVVQGAKGAGDGETTSTTAAPTTTS